MAWLLTIALQPTADSSELERQLWELGTTGIAEIDNHGASSLIAGFDDHATAEQAAVAIGPTAVVAPVDASTWPTPEPQELIVGGQLLTIEVARAFGHGHHPTTKLALDALTRLASAETSVLDVGTGTGILALAAAALGAYPVVGVDIDPEAVAVAKRNAVDNHLEVTIADCPLDLIEMQFDLVVINMLAAELAPLAPAVSQRLRPGGSLVVTGFLTGQSDWVASLFPTLTIVESVTAEQVGAGQAGAQQVESDAHWARFTFSAAPTHG